MDELRAKLGMYKTVWNYDMHANVLQIKEYWALNVQTVYGWISREARCKFWT